MHVLEPADLWERYIDPAFRNRAPRGTTRTPMDVGVTVDGADAFMLSGQIARVSFQGGLARFADDIAWGFDARAQLAAMDREGIDVTVLYPSRGLFVHSISDLDPAFSEAIARLQRLAGRLLPRRRSPPSPQSPRLRASAKRMARRRLRHLPLLL